MVGVVGSNIVPVKARFIDEDEERLNKKLKPYGRKVYKVAGEGNCQFRALSHQLFNSEEYHMEVRQNVCIRLRYEWKRYFALWNYDHDEYKAWVARMQRDGEWGNHLTLQAAADLFRKRITLVTTYEERPIITIDPNTSTVVDEGNTLWLTFKPELHYNSTVPIHTRLAEAKRLAEAERLADGTSEPFLAGARVLYEGISPGVVRVMHHDLNKTPGGIYYTVDLDDGRVVTALPKSIRALFS